MNPLSLGSQINIVHVGNKYVSNSTGNQYLGINIQTSTEAQSSQTQNFHHLPMSSSMQNHSSTPHVPVGALRDAMVPIVAQMHTLQTNMSQKWM